jgi:hypothetical protein
MKILKEIKFKNFDAEKLLKKRNILTALILFLLILMIISTPTIYSSQEIKNFNKEAKNYNVKLQIFNEENIKISEFLVAVADDKYSQIYGLMNLKKLDHDKGMLFIFDHNQVVSMWMKNTFIPLDMIFIDKNNKIVKIHKNAEPHSLEIISSEVEVDKVLEINAFLSDKFKITKNNYIKIIKE